MPASPSRIAYEKVESVALRGNPLGDPHVRTLPIYLPPGYDDSDARYPVIFVLAGFTGRGVNMLHESAWDEPLHARMDRLIASGAAKPAILVLPDCFTRYGGSQYVNSAAVGRYEDYVLELVAWVDAHFRTRASREHRGVAGKSSGGYGALCLGMRHPEIFAGVGDHCGDKGFELCYRPDFPKFARAAAKFGDWAKVLADPAAQPSRDGPFFDLMNLAAMSACYSPNRESPLGFDLPFELETCALRPDVWARWEAQDPLFMADEPRVREALASLKLLYLDCGTRDEWNLLYGCRRIVRKFAEYGIAHRYEEYDGTHRNTQWRYDTSLAALSQALA